MLSSRIEKEKLAIAQATAEVSAKQQEELKNQQSEDSADDMKAREKKEKELERKRAAASRQTDKVNSGKSLH